MARKKRFIDPGYCYHVMVRGVGGRNIFDDDKDRSRFCILLQYATETCGISIHGFCLMNNHVHLLLQPETKDLASGMHKLTFRYAQYYNKKVGRQGYLFQGRYKAITIQNGIYLRSLIRYIHRNPIRANLTHTPSAYSWSSHSAYVDEAEFTWLKKDLIFSLFASTPSEAYTPFCRYISSEDAEAKNELDEIRKSMSVGAYGSDSFVQEFLETSGYKSSTLTNNKRTESGQYSSGNQQEIKLEMIFKALEDVTTFSLDDIKSNLKFEKLVDARALFIWFVLKSKLMNLSETSQLLCRDPTSVSRLCRRAQKSPRIIQLSDEIEKVLFTE